MLYRDVAFPLMTRVEGLKLVLHMCLGYRVWGFVGGGLFGVGLLRRWGWLCTNS
jgi:hypothetical protein